MQIVSQQLTTVLVGGLAGPAAAGLFKIARSYAGALSAGVPAPSTAVIGKLFLGDYLLPFELVSLILLAALLGAVFFSHSERREAAK